MRLSLLTAGWHCRAATASRGNSPFPPHPYITYTFYLYKTAYTNNYKLIIFLTKNYFYEFKIIHGSGPDACLRSGLHRL